MAPKEVQSKYGSKKKEQGNNEGDENIQSNNGKKILEKIITELKNEIVEKPECDTCVTEPALEYKMAKLIISFTKIRCHIG